MVEKEGTIVHQGIQVPPAKQTALGLYVTAREAYEMWKAAPEKVNVLDVRMVEEYVFLGHAEGAVNIPVAFPKYEWHEDKRKYGFEMNPDFVDHVKQILKRTIPSLPCAVPGAQRIRNKYACQGGFYEYFNIIDGFEGDTVDDPENVFHGKRMKNGSKNSAPWSYDLDPAKYSSHW